MKKSLLLIALCTSALAVSCMQVNEDYDLSKGIDKTINVGGDIGIAVGSTKFLTLGSLISAEDMGLMTDSEGNYVISYSKNLNWNMAIPEFQCNVNTDQAAMMSSGITIPGSITEAIPPVNLSITHNFQTKQDNVDERLTSLTEIKCQMEISMNICLEQDPVVISSATILAGTRYILPECLHASSVSESCIEITDGNVLTFKSDFVIPSKGLDSPLMVSIDRIDFTKLPEGQGLVTPGHILIDVPWQIEGNIQFAKESSVTEIITASIGVKSELKSVNFTVFEATGSIDGIEDLSFDPIDINFGGEIVSIDDANFDFADPRVGIVATSNFPAGAEANLKICASANGNETNVAIGSKYGTTPLVFLPSEGGSKYWISTGTSHPEGYTAIQVSNLNKLFTPFPDKLEVKEASFQPATDLITVTLGKTYGIDFDVTMEMPLAFGSELYIPAEVALDELVDLGDISFSHADITAEILNTIPLGLEITGTLENSEGKVQSGVDLNLDCKVAPGKVGSPATSQFKLEIKSNSPIKSIDGIKLKIALKCSDPAYAGICLNEAQGIKLDKIKLHIYDGVTIDLN